MSFRSLTSQGELLVPDVPPGTIRRVNFGGFGDAVYRFMGKDSTLLENWMLIGSALLTLGTAQYIPCTNILDHFVKGLMYDTSGLSRYHLSGQISFHTVNAQDTVIMGVTIDDGGDPDVVIGVGHAPMTLFARGGGGSGGNSYPPSRHGTITVNQVSSTGGLREVYHAVQVALTNGSAAATVADPCAEFTAGGTLSTPAGDYALTNGQLDRPYSGETNAAAWCRQRIVRPIGGPYFAASGNFPDDTLIVLPGSNMRITPLG